MSEEIFRKFDKETEGELAKRFSFLVCKKTLIEIASNVKIDNYILVSYSIVLVCCYIIILLYRYIIILCYCYRTM